MKKAILSLVAIMLVAFVSTTYAQDDVYYDPADDYFKEEVEVVEVAEEAAPQQKTTCSQRRNIDDCSYCYTSRIRRFNNSYRGFNYYDPCYTDGYYYNSRPGTNIYLTSGSPYSNYSSYRPSSSWVTWFSPYSTFGSSYNPYYAFNSNSYGYNSGYNGYGSYGGYNNYGYGNSYNNAYCPPNAYGGSYYASSTPGSTNTAPRGTRTSNTGNATTGPRTNSGRSTGNVGSGRTQGRNTATSSRVTTQRPTRSSANTAKPSRNSSATKPSRTQKPRPFRNMMKNVGNSVQKATRSGSRSNSSTRSRGSRSNSSYKSSSSRSSSSSRATRSSRGGK